MKTINKIGLSDVQAVYSGPEGDLWELIMGQQIHIGGLTSSMDLSEQAGIGSGMSGVDLCCCNGAGMRFLLRFRNVDRMTGVDATEKVIERGRWRCAEEGLSDRINFVQADVCKTGLVSASVDFVWGEDAWCYVSDKAALVREASRLVRPGGIIAFTDWIEGPQSLSAEEAERFMRFMKFPSVQDKFGYEALLKDVGCQILVSDYTGRFAPYIELYLNMLEKQLTYDALKILAFNQELANGLLDEMRFAKQLAESGKLDQGLFVARRL
ncbi:MAG TPA: methyltransferase domain-containing protein [bacterium]|nr:methyltransferase domain-containing protein [bacterium]